MNNTYYEFRAPKSIEELREILKLRYRVYKDCRLVDFVENNQSGYDIDPHNTRAYQMGLFMQTVEGTKVIGTHREVFDGIGPHADWITQIEKEININSYKNFDYTKYPFPAFTYSEPVACALRKFYDYAKKSNKDVIEGTRYTIDPTFRSLSLARFLLEVIISVLLIDKAIGYGVIGVSSSHAPFYERHGFKKIEGIGEVDVHGVPANFMVISFDTIPTHLLERLYKMAEAYRATGSICFNPTQPDNFYEPAAATSSQIQHY